MSDVGDSLLAIEQHPRRYSRLDLAVAMAHIAIVVVAIVGCYKLLESVAAEYNHSSDSGT